MQDMTSKQPLKEVNEEAAVESKWGNKLEVDEQNPAIQLFESFEYDGLEYFLFDCVYLGYDNKFGIGKLVKIWETPDHKRMMEVVWFFRSEEIRDLFGDDEPRDLFGDDEPLPNELFLASGDGGGLSNVNHLDRRNPQASDAELSMTDFTFSRTFDVGSCRVLDNFPDTIAGTKVEYFFNRSDQDLLYPGVIPPNLNESVEKLTRLANVQQPESVGKTFNGNSYDTKLSPIAKDKKDKAHLVGISSEGKSQSSLKDFLGKDVPENQNAKRKKSLPVSDDLELQSNFASSLNLNEKCSSKILQGKNFGSRKRDFDAMCSAYQDQKISKGEITVQKVSKSVNQQPLRVSVDNKVKVKRHFIEVKRKPYTETSNWLIQQPWEERVQRANQRGTLILLENLDPSFSSLEVEDLAWQCLGEKVEAKMIEPKFISSPHYGRALVVFKSQIAAGSAISELEKKCLMLEDGRIIVGRRVSLQKPEKSATSAGYLVIPRLKFKQQREEMRNAKSTSHCSQPKTLEYDMAMEWRLLQEQSDKWWNLLNKEQEKEILKVRRQLKIWHKDKWWTLGREG